MSIHEIAIIEIGDIFPHPNPEVERMELTHVWGWQCCIGKGQFKKNDKAIYIPPDYLVPLNHPSFAFLRNKEDKTHERIRVRRFKGTLSQGLIISVPDELTSLPVGSNVIEQLGIERYEPPLPKSTYGNFVSAPSALYVPKFDVESYQRYNTLFQEGEEVIVTEKLHGASSRFVFAKNKDGEYQQFCGSRTNWMAEDEKNIWWMAYRQNSNIEKFCRNYPDLILYGEVFGQVQSLKYGAGKNDIFFAPFAILHQNTWLDYDDARKMTDEVGLKWAPEVYRGGFNLEKIALLAEGDSSWSGANHMREGVVIVPVKERTDETIGRVLLKIVSNRYLEKG